MNALLEYAQALVRKSGGSLISGDVFAKVLSRNDDSGRHGVLIPTDAYAFFPELPIPDPTQNATQQFLAFDTIAGKWKTAAYKYYERYPERRITRIHSSLNDLASDSRLFVALHAKHNDGTSAYYFDCANADGDGRFDDLFRRIFGEKVTPACGAFVLRPVDAPAFMPDPALDDLLQKFDEVRDQGWLNSLRIGDTGIGYTFETLLGIAENNNQSADFKGIEIKCQGIKEGRAASANKITLFQAGPTWGTRATAKERIRVLGRQGEGGLFACHSQVSTAMNNLGLLLKVLHAEGKVDLQKCGDALGYWPLKRLERRLSQKHSRAAFVKAKIRQSRGTTQFYYEELVYCERPSMERFLELVDRRSIVFEFLLSEKIGGNVRNHGYPWRVIRREFLDQLFEFQVKLR